jgi:cell wall-associated NlpC family hydrolase
MIAVLSTCIIACNTTKTTTKPPHQKKVYYYAGEGPNTEFYAKYSKKLGVKFKGTEDKKLIEAIAGWIGTPYVYGGCTKSGTDCSGFIKTLYKDVYNIDLNRSAYDLYKDVEEVKKKDLKFGDVVFFKISGTKISHVGLYLADNKFVHAASSKGVMVSDLTETYYTKYYYCSGRIKKLR